MNENLLARISVCFWILSAVVLFVLGILIFSVIRRNLLFRRSSVKVIHARLSALEEPKRSQLPYRGRFVGENGETMVLFIDRSQSAALMEGVEGTLTYRGNTLLSFVKK